MFLSGRRGVGERRRTVEETAGKASILEEFKGRRFSPTMALALADGDRLKTLLYHYVGDARGLEDGPGARKAAAFGRVAADAARRASAADGYAEAAAADDAAAGARALDDVLAVARALRCPVFFASGAGLYAALCDGGGRRADFALLQLRELYAGLKDRAPRGSPKALDALRTLPKPRARAAPPARAPDPPPPAAETKRQPPRPPAAPPWAR